MSPFEYTFSYCTSIIIIIIIIAVLLSVKPSKKIIFHTIYFSMNFFLVVLLDTTKEATLEWTSYPYGPQAQRPGVSLTFHQPPSVVLENLLFRLFILKQNYFLHFTETYFMLNNFHNMRRASVERVVFRE